MQAAAGQPAKFTQGSIFRHVAVMTATGSIGLIAVFVVDFLSLLYIAQYGDEVLTAAVGYATTLLFFLISISVGLMIAATALVSRAIGAGRREDARRLSASNVAVSTGAIAIASFGLLLVLDPVLGLMGATGRTLEVARHFLVISIPSMPIMAIGMATSGLLRAVGDAKRAMYVTLSAAFAAAILDPILIFGFGWGVTGAAIATVLARIAMAAIGLHGAVRVHGLLARPSVEGVRKDWRPIAGIAVPAILTNVATPVGLAWVTAAIAPFGDSAMAGWSVINRLVPLAFGGLFALSGAVGPIFGQNLGAGQYDRVRRTVTGSLSFALVYTLSVWLALFVASDQVAALFGLTGEGARLVVFFCEIVAGVYVFMGGLFVANAAFNNLGFPTLSTLFNWGRATLGTVPFVLMGAQWAGAPGVVAGQGLGWILFGVGAVVVCYRVVGRLGGTKAAAEAGPLSEDPHWRA